MMQKANSLMAIFLITVTIGYGQDEANYDESNVPHYQLPELLTSQKGKEITNAEDWMEIRRPEVLSLFEDHVYGKIPGKLEISSWEILEENYNALNNKAIRKQVLLTFNNNGKQLDVNLLIYLPKNVEKSPLFVGYNFYGNHTIAGDSEIIIPTSWSRNNEDFGVTNNKPTAKSRGIRESRWTPGKIIDAGYGLATIYYGDIDPDKYGEAGVDFSDGVHPLLYEKGQTKPHSDEWRAISAWAWGLSRAMDYFEKDNDIDSDQIAVMGHSRLGKASLWAGALDERFAIVISNNSGSGGAALSKRKYGERLGRMTKVFPNWFSGTLEQYYDNEEAMPVDQHMLIALIAPRPVYVASAEEDKWADPRGEYLAVYHASPVFELFGRKGFSSSTMPGINQPVITTTGYHIRSGGHDVTDFDWDQYIKFADMHLKPYGRSPGQK